jgi:carbon storage regulator
MEVNPMLVLSRKECERILIGDNTVITVVRIGRDKVRLGIEAPKDLEVLREELKGQPRRTAVPAPAAQNVTA